MDIISPKLPQNKAPRILEQGLISSEDDLAKLGLFDWNRSYSNPAKFMRGITNWTRKAMKYSIMKCEMHRSPHREDFPDWKHVGSHERMGSLYWNWFYDQFADCPDKELLFNDSPDFSGCITFPSGTTTRFWGDIGRCSAFAFVESMLQMHPGDLWITLPDSSTQIILEAQVDYFGISQLQSTIFRPDLMPLQKPSQMCLF